MELTCPECCYVALQRIGRYQWECKVCGTSFDFVRLRGALKALSGSQFPADFIAELLGDAKLDGAPEFGERGFKFVGKHGTINAIDMRNNWFIVLKCQKKSIKKISK
jgi:hypothetical protein